MAYQSRTVQEWQDLILAHASAAYSAQGISLVIGYGSDAWLRARAIAIQLYELQAAAQQTVNDLLPDRASVDALVRHGTVQGVPVEPAVAAQVTVTVSGSVAGTYAIPTACQLIYQSQGVMYAPTVTTVTLSGGSPPYTGTVTTLCLLPGTIGTRTVGDTLTWTSPPSGLNPTATVSAIPVPGQNVEQLEAYRQRVIERIQNRPGSGNRTDWKLWTELFSGVDVAFVYPLFDARFVVNTGAIDGYGPNVPGALTVIAMGPPQGDAYEDSRVLDVDGFRDYWNRVTGAEDFINGDATADGVAITDGSGTQLRPATVPSDAYGIYTIGVQQAYLGLLVETALTDWPGAEVWTIDSTTWTNSTDPFDITVVIGHAVDSIAALNGANAMILSATAVLIRTGPSTYTRATIDPAGSLAGGAVISVSAGHGITANPASVSSPRVRFYGPFTIVSTTWVNPGTAAFDIVVKGWMGTDITATLSGKEVAFNVEGDEVRGSLWYATVETASASVSTSTPTTTLHFAAGAGVTIKPETAGGAVWAVPTQGAAIRSAVFDYMDSLGPADTDPPSRYPATDAAYPPFLRDAPIIARVIPQTVDGVDFGVTGVIDVDVYVTSATTDPFEPVAGQVPSIPGAVFGLVTLIQTPSRFET